MDYRYYRGDGPQLPPKLTKHIYKLRYVGTVMLIAGVVLPFLMTIHVFKSTFFLNFLTTILTTLGMTFVVVGLVFDNLIDRAE